MGLRIGISSSRLSTSSGWEPTMVVAPNPDPYRFQIRKIEVVGSTIVAWINYPDCTNYEGNKILLFKGVSLTELTSASALDPHFAPTPLSPFARFSPTSEGWEVALRCAALIG